MNKNLIFATFVASLGLGWLGGCASTTPASDPTHRWQSADPVSAGQYNRDNSLCLNAANLQLEALRAETPSFKAYRSCMVMRGYTLETQ